MAAKSYTLDDALIDHVLRNSAYASPAQVYAGLFTVMPANPGDAGTEVTTIGTAYARQAVTFAGPTNGATSNSAGVTFPTATLAWGTVVGVGIYDNNVGGNLLYYGTLGTSKVIGVGDSASFAVSALTVTEQ